MNTSILIGRSLVISCRPFSRAVDFGDLLYSLMTAMPSDICLNFKRFYQPNQTQNHHKP